MKIIPLIQELFQKILPNTCVKEVFRYFHKNKGSMQKGQDAFVELFGRSMQRHPYTSIR